MFNLESGNMSQLSFEGHILKIILVSKVYVKLSEDNQVLETFM